MAEQAPRRLMKDGLDHAAVNRLCEALCAGDTNFDSRKFQRLAMSGLHERELKERVRHLIGAMATCLTTDFAEALPIVLAAGEAFPAGDPDDSLRGFAAWPLIDWVSVYGLDHFAESMAALRRLTPLFSAEFAVRPFLLADTDAALTIMREWLDDPDPHVRRLVSEGTRPRLPWGEQLPMFRRNPAPVVTLLAELRDDPSKYVRRSVANNLNDIAKDHPDVVVATAEAWWADASQERQALVRHGLRTLVKQGDAGALTVLGYTTTPEVEVVFGLSRAKLRLGESQELVLQLRSKALAPQKLVVDYIVHHQRANGTMTAKVFKWRVVDLPDAGEARLVKKHAFVPRSVRRLYPGEHRIEVSVGGQILASAEFQLLPENG